MINTSLNDTSKKSVGKVFMQAQFTKFDPESNNNDLYKGQYIIDPVSQNLIKHGLGSMQYENGSIYEG